GAASVAVANALPMSKPLKLPPVTVTATSWWFPSQTTTFSPVPTVGDCVSGGCCSTVTSTTPVPPSQVKCSATSTTTSVTYCAWSRMLTLVAPSALAGAAPAATSASPAATAASQRTCFICLP